MNSQLERPTCSCGVAMVTIHDTGSWLCPHCDQPCPKTEENCPEHRLLHRAVQRKHETTAPPSEMRKDR